MTFIFGNANREGVMQKGVGFVRIKPIQCEKSAESRADDNELFDPFVAVKILDAENVPG